MRARRQISPAAGHGRSGVRTLRFIDQTRATPPNGSFAGTPFRPLDTEVWYPAAAPPTGAALRDAPLDTSGAPYPLILYGHALQDSRTGEAYLAEHLASRGYIVAAVDFPLGKLGAPGGATPDDLANQPGDLRAVLEHLLAGDGGLAGAVDAARVGASGLSLGAATVMLLTYHRDLRDRRIRAVLPIAPAFSCAFTRAFYKGARRPCWSCKATPTVSRRSRRTGSASSGVRGGHARSSSCTAARISASRDSPVHSELPGTSIVSGAPRCSGRSVPARSSRRSRVDAAAGVASDACSPPCQAAPPLATLDFERQHELTRIVAAAFFDASLGGDRSARCWLARGLAAENPDVATRRH